LQRVGARRWSLRRGRVRGRRAAVVAAHAPDNRRVVLSLQFRHGRRHGRERRWALLLNVFRFLLLLGAPHATVARHLCGRRRRGYCFRAHVVLQCFGVPAHSRCIEVRGLNAGQIGRAVARGMASKNTMGHRQVGPVEPEGRLLRTM
jgi:hypothetical protein